MRRVLFLILSVFVTSYSFGETETEIVLNRHEDMRLSSEVGHQQDRGVFIATQFRYALHDLLDRQGDYPHATSIELLSAKWRVHFQNTRPWLDELTIIRVLRIPTLSDNGGELSWNVDTGLRTAREKFCANCLAGHIRGGLGFTEAPVKGFPLEVYVLGDAEISLAPDATDSAFQPAVGPRLGVRLWWKENIKTLTEFRYRYYFLADSPSVFEASTAVRYYLGWDLAVEARIARLSDGWEYAAGLYAYF